MFHGLGGGAFSNAGNAGAGCAIGITTADVNGDARPDVIAANACELSVLVLINDMLFTGTFQ